MSESQIDIQNQKTKISLMAILSPLLVILGFPLMALVSTISDNSLFQDICIGVYIISILCGLVIGIIADHRIRKSNGRLKGRVFSILGFVMAIIVFFLVLEPIGPPRGIAYRMVCGSNMFGLGKSLQAYSTEFKGKYPPVDKWCDLLIKDVNVSAKEFICPVALKKGDKGRCHYAINPNAEPNSPGDIALLFETKGGWNQHGGKEILTTKNHKDKGCNVLFNDGHVEFVKAEDIGKLKW